MTMYKNSRELYKMPSDEVPTPKFLNCLKKKMNRKLN